MLAPRIYDKFLAAGFGVAIIGGLYLSSLQSYLLFHTLIELLTVAVAFTIFILFWSTQRYVESGYFRIVCVGFTFVALIDLLHTLAYKGMGIFPSDSANLPTQLWIASRYMQAVTLIVAPLLVARQLDNRTIFAAYLVATTVLLAVVFGGYFPDCYIDAQGLTPFKIYSEYAISLVLIISLYLFYRIRVNFSRHAFLLVGTSIVLTICTELAFTTYVSVYGFSNMVGHFAKLGAYYLLCRAVILTSLKEPMDYIFGGLRLTEEELKNTHATLLREIGQRSGAIQETNEKYLSLLQTIRVLADVTRGRGQEPQCTVSTTEEPSKVTHATNVSHRL